MRPLNEALLLKIDAFCSRLNIFGLYNSLWGLARMQYDKTLLGPKLTDALLARTVYVLHTFLPEHFGDVIWALGTMNFSLQDLSTSNQDRVLAILSK